MFAGDPRGQSLRPPLWRVGKLIGSKRIFFHLNVVSGSRGKHVTAVYDPYWLYEMLMEVVNVLTDPVLQRSPPTAM